MSLKMHLKMSYGDPWDGFQKGHLTSFNDSVVDALVSMDYMSEAAARNWCEKAIEPYTISIEDFCKACESIYRQ